MKHLIGVSTGTQPGNREGVARLLNATGPESITVWKI